MDNKQKAVQELNLDQMENISGGKREGQCYICPHCQATFGINAPMMYYEHLRSCQGNETESATAALR